MISVSLFKFFLRSIFSSKIGYLLLLAMASNFAMAVTYNLTSGQYPPCIGGSGWSVSGTTYTCGGNGRVTLANSDILTANTNITIVAANGFSLTNNTIGTAANRISLQTQYGSIDSTATTTINGSLQSIGSGAINLNGTTVTGTVSTGGAISLSNSSITGLVTSTSNIITATGTNLQGGATAQSGMSITGGVISGNFTLTSNNQATFSGVTMPSGTISGASTVSITNGSTFGSPSSAITISSNSGEITVNNSTVYGNLTAPGYSTVRLTNGGAVYGTCLPNSTPANACTPASTILGSWRMDEPYWNGTANEVIDSSGNNNHGRARIASGSTPTASTALVTPALVTGSQSTCSYGQFDSVTSPVRTHTYVELSGFPALPSSFTFTAWIRSTNASAQHQRILVRDDAQNGWGLSLADGTGEPRLRFFNRNIQNFGAVTGQGRNGNCGVFCLDTNTVIVNNAWHFIAATIDTSARTVTLYVYSQSGTLLARTSSAYSGNWVDGTGTAAIGGETLASAEGQQSSFHFLGNIDEMEIYTGALSQSYIESLRSRVRTCPPISPHHYELQIPSSSIACMATPVTVVACADSSSPCTNSYLAAGGTTANLATTGGTLANSTVTFDNGGVATTTLTHPLAVNGASVSVTLSGEQLAGLNPRRCCRDNACTFASACTTTFNTAGLAFATSTAPNTLSLPNQVAGTVGSTPLLRAVRTNTSTGACEARLTGTRTVQLAYECRNPTSCVSGQTLTLNGNAARANNNNATIAFNNVSLTFSSSGSAPIPINYSDVGRLRLHARLEVAASAPEPAATLIGTSNEFVVKPHTLAVTSVTGNPETTASGTGFIPAGQAFTVQIEARNALGNRTPNFGNELVSKRANITLEPAVLVYPLGGSLGTLTGVAPGTFTAITPAATFRNTTAVWDEVGSLRLRARLSDNDYLGAGDLAVLTPSVTVGRFYPDHFTMDPPTISDSCNSFSYMGHPAMGFSYRLQAKNVNGNVTSNYHFPTYSNIATISYVAENANDGVNHGGRVQAATANWINGVMQVADTSGAFARINILDGPFNNLQLGVRLVDALDARQLQGRNMNADTAGDCNANNSCNAVALGSPRVMRFGRLRLDDTFGPESVDLPVRFATEYWSNGVFLNSITDSCTIIPLAAISYPSGTIDNPANRTVPLPGGSTQGQYLNLQSDGVHFANGSASHSFSAPITGTGRFDVTVNLGAADCDPASGALCLPWLRYDWNQNGNHNDDILLRANIGFGQYRGHDRIIYWREVFE